MFGRKGDKDAFAWRLGKGHCWRWDISKGPIAGLILLDSVQTAVIYGNFFQYLIIQDLLRRILEYLGRVIATPWNRYDHTSLLST
jgi:hypothetical protein